MRIFQFLFLLFLFIPVIEIYLLIQVGSMIGALNTIGLVILTAVLGATLLRQQGLATLANARTSMSQGQLPAVNLVEGVILLVCGALLLTPGFFTDVIGFAGLLPPLRRSLAIGFLRHAVITPGPGGGFQAHYEYHSRRDDGIIEGEYEREESDNDPNRRLR